MIISKKARDKYNLSDFINYTDLIAIFDDYNIAKIFAEKVNKIREQNEKIIPERYVRASVINALGLLDELYLSVINGYFKENEILSDELLKFLEEQIGQKELNAVMKNFTDMYPSNRLYNNKTTFEEFINDSTEGIDNKTLVINEIILAYLTYNNQAIDDQAYGDFIKSENIIEDQNYIQFFSSINEFFEDKPKISLESDLNLLEYLIEPFTGSKTLDGQLRFINKNWTKYLNSKQVTRLLSAIAYILEENDLIWKMYHPGGAFSPILTYDLGEYEAFSPDQDWMPNVVMISKSTYVWLDQLSKKYKTHISRLDQIPDDELMQIRNRGINAIWLIGIWERSRASKRLKHIMGNPEAEASAYSLKDYAVSYDIGGHLSYENLRDRANRFGIRLASDMVPNHMGIDSNIIFDRPDFFISLDHSPYPSYTFNGHNYSENSDFGIFIEDHYYNHSDAAVVFKFVNFKTGETRFIYHGNDGTSIPWNDTAQLDFLKAEVRNWVIQNILHVARMFPIIRFDAAMTLAKGQFQRLWYPEPGNPAGVASRSTYTVSSQIFNEFFPNEFWREVVDTVAEKVPNTLLLAEAFWMLEGYFVRTLGMHRVYNSAFMNMLKSELNDQYRTTIKNTLEFDPEILKRFVNFMSNPDEETAVAQFGKEDKYFGVLLMMVTMPGLPMIGHGQIEGFSEKYGMEFKKAYWNEQEDYNLIKRHEIEIFPLLHKRWLFSNVRYFRLFDFYQSDGRVDENVFAYSNGTQDKRALIIYHNRYAGTSGWIKRSARYLDRWSENREYFHENLANALLLTNKEEFFVIFKDLKANLEFIRRSTDVFNNGLHLILGAYQYHIFMDFYEVQDTIDKAYTKVHDFLNGRGTRSIQDTLLDMELRGIQNSFRDLLNKELFASIEGKENFPRFLKRLFAFFKEITFKEGIKFDNENIEKNVRALFELYISSDKIEQTLAPIKIHENSKNNVFESLQLEATNKNPIFFILICLLFTGDDTKSNSNSFNEKSFNYVESWRLKKLIYSFFKELSYSDEKANESVLLTLILLKYFSLPEDTYPSNFVLYIAYDIFSDPLITEYLKINYYNNEYWYNKERFMTLMSYLIVNIILYNKPNLTIKLVPKLLTMIKMSDLSEYRVSKLRKLLKEIEHKSIINPFSKSNQ